MAYDSRVYRVMIASPGDVVRERRAIPEVINLWNAKHSAHMKVTLLPVMWETHSTPDLSDKAQAVINRQVLDNSDIVIAAFWSKLGTPTEEAASGTVEEIERGLQEGKRVLLYFSKAPLPNDVNADQIDRLRTFKEECFKRGLVREYRNVNQLRSDLDAHITNVVRELMATPPVEMNGMPGPNLKQEQPTEVVDALLSANPTREAQVLPEFTFSNTPSFFSGRISEAFPGVRGLKTYSGKEAVSRLARLLKGPLEFSLPDGGTMTPIWWWHGHACLDIYRFEIMDQELGKCLINDMELVIDTLTVYHSSDYQCHFVYLVTKGDSPCGIYPMTQEDIDRQVANSGYAYEEMGYLDGRYITRAEYDDGFAEIEGELVDADGAEIRTRYLTPYNLVIASVHTPFNDSRVDDIHDRLIAALLRNEIGIELFVEFIEKLPRNEDLYRWKDRIHD